MRDTLTQALLDQIELMKLGLSDYSLHVVIVLLTSDSSCAYVSMMYIQYSPNGKLRPNTNDPEPFGSQPKEVFEQDGDLYQQSLEIGFKRAQELGYDLVQHFGTREFFIAKTREPIDLSDFIVQ
jgi:hypothetical protein